MDAFLHAPSEPTMQYVAGNYTGNNAVTRFINIGFTPKAVLVFGVESQYGTDVGFVSIGRTITGYGGSIILRIDSNGFTVGYSGVGGGAGTNRDTRTYSYIAFK